MSTETVQTLRPESRPVGSRRPAPVWIAFVAAAAAVFAVPSTLHAQSVRGDLAMANGSVAAELVAGGKLYVGGSFTNVGPPTGCGVPVDTASGQVVSGFPVVVGTIQAVVSDGAGGWFIGGAFTTVGGQLRPNLAHVLADLSVADWSPAPDQQVVCLALHGGAVYAGGDFLAIGGQPRSRVAALDPSTGLALAWNPGASASVRALAVTDSVIYAGGDFLTIGGQPRNHIAALDLASGVATPWNPGTNGSVLVLAASDGIVYAGGFFSTLGGQSRVNLGAVSAATGLTTAWNPQPDNQVLAIARQGNRVYVGGAFTKIGAVSRSRIAAVDATSGLAIGSWNPAASDKVLALAVSGSVVYAAGDFTAVGGQPRTHVAALDSTSGLATAWNPSAYGPVRGLAVSGSSLYVGGSFNGIGGAVRRSLAQIDLATGEVTSWDPGTNGQVLALAWYGEALVVGGQFSAVGGQLRNNLAAIDATTGSVTSWDPNVGGVVSVLAVRDSTVYAGGAFSTIGGQARSNLAAIDAVGALATSWDPNVDGQVLAIVPSGGAVYFGGAFSTVGGQTRRNLAAVDGVTASVTPWNPDPNGTVRALVETCGSFYVGGFFTSIGGQARNRVAVLDAGTGDAAPWNPSADGPIFTLAPHGGAVYTSGLFGSIGGQARSRVASLDAVTGLASSWNPGSDNIVRVFVADGSTVYAGGSFLTLGGKSVSGLAGIDVDGSLSCPAIALSPSSLPEGRVGEEYQQVVSATGGSGPFCYAVTSGALPPGIALDPASGEVSGTATAAGSFSFTVTATSATACTGDHAYELVVDPPCLPIAILPATLPLSQVDTAYAETLGVEGGVPPFSFSVSAGTLPDGIALSPEGVLSGTPTVVGTSVFTVAVTDAIRCLSAIDYTLHVFPPCTPITITPTFLLSGAVGVPFDQALMATGDRPPYTWSVTSGALPAGIALDPVTGRLQGTPAEPDTFPVIIAAHDSIGCSGTRPYLITVFATPAVSSVAADAAGLLITNGNPCVGVPVVYTRGESQPVADVCVAFEIDTTRLALCTPATPAASFHPGAWLDGYTNTSFSVTDEGGGAYRVDLGLVGEPCGITSGGTLFTVDLAAAGPDGNGAITVTAVTVRDCAGALVPVDPGPAESLAIDQKPLAVRPAALTGGSLGDPYAVTLTTDEGTGPFTWTVRSGSLPPGLTLDFASGELAGVPTQIGTYHFTVSAADAMGRTGTGSYSISIFAEAPASLVSAATGSCITRAHPQVALPFFYSRIDSTAARGVSVTFQLDLSRIALATPADPAASIHAGSWFAGYTTALLVTDNGAGSYTVDGTLLGAPCGPTVGGELFTVDLTAVGEDGNAEIPVIAVRVRDCENAAIAVAAGPVSALTVDLAGPAPVADLAAAEAIVTGSSDSTTSILLNWSPSAAEHTDLYRAPLGTYPLYVDASTPPDSSLVPGGPWTHVATDPAPGFVDQPPARGVWDYVAVVTDSCGATVISNMTRGTLNYLLGDVSDGFAAGTGNNSVGPEDISLLGAYYGLTGPSSVDPVGYLDVGPTLDGTPHSRPLPDHRINFEDFMIFAINYGVVAGAPAPLQMARGGARGTVVLAEGQPERLTVEGPARVEAGSEVTATLRLAAGGRLRGFSAQLEWDATVVDLVGMESGGFIEGQGGVVLLPRPGCVDAAILGRREIGISGEGEVVRVRLRALAAGDPQLRLASVDGRDAQNNKVAFSVTAAPELPSVTEMGPVRPNPFSQATTLRFSLAQGGPVDLVVYTVSGRRVRALAHGEREAGEHSAEWDGRDDGGKAVAAGVYFVRLTTPQGRFTRTLVLLR